MRSTLNKTVTLTLQLRGRLLLIAYVFRLHDRIGTKQKHYELADRAVS